MNAESQTYLILIYQVPSQPSAARVGVWRELKRLGALYVQQSVCMVPHTAALEADLDRVSARIRDLGGTYHLLPVHSLPPHEEAKIRDGFRAQAVQQYDEIIENCDVNFAKEIEFETFRRNFTYAEAEEIRQDLEKIKRWFDRVVERDWFAAPRRAETEQAIARCEHLLEEFEERVFAHQSDGGEAGGRAAPPRAVRRLPARRPSPRRRSPPHPT